MAEKTLGKELQAGDKAPDFSVPDQNGKATSLSQYKGKWVVLYFYPKDDTPGCTIEAIDFTKYLPNFEKVNAQILGVSCDSCESHQKFIKKKDLKIMLLSDAGKEIVKKYGVWGPKTFMGRTYDGITRATFLIDPQGKIARVWPKVKAEGHAEDVQGALAELQAK